MEVKTKREVEKDRSEIVIILIDKAIDQKNNNSIDYDYWENLLFRMVDNYKMSNSEAYAIDKILNLNLY